MKQHREAPATETRPGEDLDALREFKVQIPLSLHFELHRRRLLTGQAISETVSAALERYLDGKAPHDVQA